MIFKKKDNEAGYEEPLDDSIPDDMKPEGAPEVDAGEDLAAAMAALDRTQGPFDISEVAEPDAMAGERIDFGAVQVPLVDGLEIRVELDQESNEPAAVTLVHGQGAVQVRAFAAPRTGGAWEDVLADLRTEITEGGGSPDESTGPFGTQVLAAVTGQDEQGNQVVQPIRFVGVDGPRWLLQGVFFGEGTDPERAGNLESIFRSLVVVRGDTAMPVGAMLPLSLPEQVPGQVEESSDDPAD